MSKTRTIYDTNSWQQKDYPGNHWVFGKPVLRSTGVSQAYWAKSCISPYPQKGGGWYALLYGGVQSGSNWAGIYIPVNEMPITSFEEAQWSYYMTGTETMGVNIVIWIHDPTDFDKRAEVTQVGGVSGLDKAAGWNAHSFSPSTTQMFFYGEGTTGTGLTAGTQYTWEQFQADTIFDGWTIYRVSLEHGWEASGTFDQVWVPEIKLNGVKIPLEPTRDDLEAMIFQYHTATSGALATALSPKTPFRLVSLDLKIDTAGTTSESFTATVDAGRGSGYDTLLYSVNTLTGSTTGGTITNLHVPFGEGYDFVEDDEIDCAWTNTEARTYGLTYAFRVLP